jgi:AraC-like DNA-binding protein
MLWLQRVPGPRLDAFIEALWVCRFEPRPFAFERVLPTGAAQLIVNLAEDQTRVYLPESGYLCETTCGTMLSGVQTRYAVIDTREQEYVAGVSFRAGGTLPFFRVPADEMRDASVPLKILCGRRAAELRERLLEAADPPAILDALERALAGLLTPCVPHPAAAYALDAFSRPGHGGTVAAVTAQTGLSPKRFIERFKQAAGVSPKHYCRIQRFRRAVAQANRGRSVDWTRVAVDCGYFDQAHFIHDFRAFSGITPGAYESLRTEFPSHVKFLQSGAAAS